MTELAKPATPKPPFNPEKAAEVFALAESIRVNALAKAQTASELCIALAIERVKLQCVDAEAYDIRRLRASMSELAKQWRDPVEALEAASTKGDLDFPSTFGQGRASLSLRTACRAVLAEIATARAALPSRLEASLLGADIPQSAAPSLRPLAL